jgi:hypothetical protein
MRAPNQAGRRRLVWAALGVVLLVAVVVAVGVVALQRSAAVVHYHPVVASGWRSGIAQLQHIISTYTR